MVYFIDQSEDEASMVWSSQVIRDGGNVTGFGAVTPIIAAGFDTGDTSAW